MTNKEEQIKNSFIYFIPVAVSGLVPIITLPIYTRILTKEDFGVLALAQIYAILASGLANFGMANIYKRNFFQYRNMKEESQLLYSTILFVFSTLALLAILTYIFKATISDLFIGTPEHAGLLFWSYCSVGALSLNTYFLTYFKNSEDAKKFTRYSINHTIFAAVISIILVVYVRAGVIGLVLGQLLSGLVIFMVLILKFTKVLTFSLSWPVLRESLKLSYPLTPRIFFVVINSQFDKYMIGLLSTIGGVGIYSIGQKIGYAVFTFITSLQNVFSPQVYKKMFPKGEEGGESIGRYLTPFLYISIAAALLLALFSEEVVYILTPESYHGAIDIVIVLSMFYASLFFGKQSQLIFTKKTFIVSALSFFSIGLNIALNIPFIMKWGAIGAAWATLIAGLVSGTASFLVSQHYYNIKWEYNKAGLIILVFVTSAISLLLMRHFDVDYPMKLSFKIFSAALYCYLGNRFNILTRDSFMLVKETILSSRSKKPAV